MRPRPPQPPSKIRPSSLVALFVSIFPTSPLLNWFLPVSPQFWAWVAYRLIEARKSATQISISVLRNSDMRGKRSRTVSSSNLFPHRGTNPQKKQSATGTDLIEETPMQAESATPPPSNYPSSSTKLPSPPSSNDSEQGEIEEDKVGQTRFHRWSLGLNAVQEELQLLDDGTPGITESFEHEVKTAPLFTRDAKLPAGFSPNKSQYGLLGSLIGIRQVLSKRVTGDDHQLILFF